MCDRLDVETSKFNYKKLCKIILFAPFAVVLLSVGFYTVLILISYIDVNFNFTKSYPTSIPGIDDQFQCENSARTWRNDKCWDDKHDPLF
jgi:hypothetical protein